MNETTNTAPCACHTVPSVVACADRRNLTSRARDVGVGIRFPTRGAVAIVCTVEMCTRPTAAGIVCGNRNFTSAEACEAWLDSVAGAIFEASKGR